MYNRDWRNALRTPPSYRLGNRSLRFNVHFALLALVIGAFFVFLFVHLSSSNSPEPTFLRNYGSTRANAFENELSSPKILHKHDAINYNATYPLTSPVRGKDGSITYRIGMVADLDTNSKFVKEDGSTVWRSYLKKGELSYYPKKKEIRVQWNVGEPIVLESEFALKGRGMELSELVTFNGRLLTFDDRTGLIYELIGTKPVPWVIMLDGNGHNNTKGFKAEWATVKQSRLYVGSMGKEWTTSSGMYENDNPMFVKSISTTGEVSSHNWAFPYKKMRHDAMEISWPGYMIHESGIWSDVHNKWFFLPRRCSKERYNETQDEYMGCNLLISADTDFEHIQTVTLSKLKSPNTHGFSSFKFIPMTDDRIIIAIKTEELHGKTSTFITAFNIEGEIILPEERIDTNLKYEGFEFI